MFFFSVPSLMITRGFWGGIVIARSLRTWLGIFLNSTTAFLRSRPRYVPLPAESLRPTLGPFQKIKTEKQFLTFRMHRPLGSTRIGPGRLQTGIHGRFS